MSLIKFSCFAAFFFLVLPATYGVGAEPVVEAREYVAASSSDLFGDVQNRLKKLDEKGGGTLHFPAGRYTVKMPKWTDSGESWWQLNGNVKVSLEPGTRIYVDAKSSGGKYLLFRVEGEKNIIEGGTLIGDRKNLLGGKIATLIQVFGAKDTIVRNINIEDAGLDGITIAGAVGSPARRTRIVDVDIKNSKRNGLSATNAIELWVDRSTFQRSNGDKPNDGIDLEPNSDNEVRKVWISNCLFANNAGAGLRVISGVAGRKETRAATSGVHVSGCRFENNLTWSFIASRADNLKVVDCVSVKDEGGAFAFTDVDNGVIRGCTAKGKDLKTAVYCQGVYDFLITGNPRLEGEVRVRDAANVSSPNGRRSTRVFIQNNNIVAEKTGIRLESVAKSFVQSNSIRSGNTPIWSNAATSETVVRDNISGPLR